MKKLFALMLTVSFILSLASCSLVRKIEKSDTEEISKDTAADTTEQRTDFSETEDTSGTEEVRYTEDEAYSQLSESLKNQYPDGGYTIEKTGDMTAQSNGSEYYIFNVTLPKAEDDESDAEATKYYVSVNGIIYTSLEEDNTTVNLAAETYTLKHGETDSDTGFAYKVEYQGTVKNNGEFCYNFIVYLEDTSGSETTLTYKTNYLVSLDGHSTGEQVIKK